MAATMPQIEELLRWSATEAKNRWRAVIREVRAVGAIASHGNVQLIIMDAGKYREMVTLLDAAEQRRKRDLE